MIDRLKVTTHRPISRDEIMEFTPRYPGCADLTVRQSEDNFWLRTKVSDLIKPPSDMWERLFGTMQAAGGCGLSANQIGLHVRAFVMETPRQVKVMDPVILEVSDDEVSFAEGCLSVDGKFVDNNSIDRPHAIVVEYDNGTSRVREGLVGFEARVFQHEYDHLNGFIYTDHRIIKKNIRKQMLLTAGTFEPSVVDFDSLTEKITIDDVDTDTEFQYHDPSSDIFRTAYGSFRQRLLKLIDDSLISSIEAW